MSVLAFAPWAQPGVQWPRLMQGARPSYSVVATVVSDGHQCQPSRFIARAQAMPVRPSGIGGIGGSRGGTPGSPARPDTPIMRSFSAKNGSRVQ